jgi:hypothetical protein
MTASQTTAARPESGNGYRAGAFPRAITTAVESTLRLAGRVVRRPDPVWFELSDHLLADVGKTRTEAEAEAACCAWRTPLGAMADGVTSKDLARPRLPRSRLD